MPVITSSEQVTIEWLAQAVQATDWLDSFELQPLSSATASVYRIGLKYSPDAPTALPNSVILKLCEVGRQAFQFSEVDYYLRDYFGLPEASLPRCYEAVAGVEQGAYHLLLEDLSATHHNNWRTTPTTSYGQVVAEALARMHAYWWGAARLNAAGHTIPAAPSIERYMANIEPGLAPMLNELATEPDFDPLWREWLPRIFERHPPRMLTRTANLTGFTLIHGDLNPGNILSPLQGNEPVYFIDRQPFEWSLTTWLGVSDLAYMMVHWWSPELRRLLELGILRHYYTTLTSAGVTDYSWEQLLADYRLCAVQSVYVATNWCIDPVERQQMKWVWRPQLQKAMTAFFDLGCDKDLAGSC